MKKWRMFNKIYVVKSSIEFVGKVMIIGCYASCLTGSDETDRGTLFYESLLAILHQHLRIQIQAPTEAKERTVSTMHSSSELYVNPSTSILLRTSTLYESGSATVRQIRTTRMGQYILPPPPID